MTDIREIITRWDSGEGKPYKGSLIDWSAYQADPENIGCMCAQGQILHLSGGWSFDDLRKADQAKADLETAGLLNISRAHAVLLRNINDSMDGAPSVVLTDPGKVLGDQWSRLLDFWWAFDQLDAARWKEVAAARDAAWAAGDAARAAAWAAGDAARAAAWAARAAAGDAAGDAARAAARDAAGDAARAAARAAARDAAGDAAGEIQGSAILFDQGKPLFFLPMFGWAAPDEIPARPEDYGLGIVPAGLIAAKREELG